MCYNKQFWVNGVSAQYITLDNRALHFGDGFFTTAQIKNGKVVFIDQHMDRLITTARRLMFNNLDYDLLYKEITQAAKHSVNGVIKVIITRINHGTTYGYQCGRNAKSIRIIGTYPLSNRYNKWIKYGVRLSVSSVRIARHSFFSGIKHLNRLDQVMIATEVFNNKIADEALVLDTEGKVVECCSANIFWRLNNYVFTPSVYYAGVDGIIRQLIIKLLPSLGYNIQEVMVSIDHLKNMEEVFITNSLLPLVSVNSIDNFIYKNKTLFNVLSSYFARIMT